MPIEIRELHIKMAVTTPSPASPAGAPAPAVPAAPTDALVAICVEQVMDLLRRERER